MSNTTGSGSSPLLERFPLLATAVLIGPGGWPAATGSDAIDWFSFEANEDPDVVDRYRVQATIGLPAQLAGALGLVEASSTFTLSGAVDTHGGDWVEVHLVTAPVPVSAGVLGPINLIVRLTTEQTDAEGVVLHAVVEFDLDLAPGEPVTVRAAISDAPRVALSWKAERGDVHHVDGFAALGHLLGPACSEAPADLGEPLASMTGFEVRSLEVELRVPDDGDPVAMVGIGFAAVHTWDVAGGITSSPVTAELDVAFYVFEPFQPTRSLRVEVEVDLGDLPVVPGVVELAEARAWLAVDAAPGTPRWSFNGRGGISGDFTWTNGGHVRVEIPLPLSSGDWRFELAAGATPLTMGSLEALLHTQLPPPLHELASDIGLGNVALVIDGSERRLTELSVMIETTESLRLAGTESQPQLVLESFHAHMAVERSASNATTTGDIAGHLRIANTPVAVSVSKLMPDAGWTAAVGAVEIGPITLDEIVTHLGEVAQLGPWSDEIPESLRERTFTLRDLAVDYKLTNRRLDRLAFELHSDPPPAAVAAGTGSAPLAGLALTLAVDAEQTDAGRTTKITGTASLDELELELFFDRASKGTQTDAIIGGFIVDSDGVALPLGDLVRAVAPGVLDAGVELHAGLDDVVVALGTGWQLVAADLDGRINLAAVPLVGTVLPAGKTVALALRAIVTSKADDEQKKKKLTEGVKRLNTLLPPTIKSLPEDHDAAQQVTLIGALQLGADAVTLDLPVTMHDDGTVQPAASGGAGPAARPVPSGGGIHWIKLQRHFGPLHFARIGVALDGEHLRLALDASVEVAGLTLLLDGLAMSTPLTALSPTFHLDGIGLDYSNGDIEVGGSFREVDNGKVGGSLTQSKEYAGSATIRTPKLTLAAMGDFTTGTGPASLVVSAVLDAPLGGPAFFYVTGLSAAFGHNRSLTMPDVSAVKDFPLVAQALRGAGHGGGDDLLDDLRAATPSALGEHFLGVGVSFTSFKQIDSFAMLLVQFGTRTEIDLLGFSHMVVPRAEGASTSQPIADVELGLRGRFVPEVGELAIEARLTPNSYVLSKACHLSGGFAFSSWFHGVHEGDFVLSVGGYHPSFSPPAHYPAVPRVGFDWTVDPHLSIKGSGYFALTPGLIMAGGQLSAAYHNGALAASFELRIDFLLAWKPLHYDVAVRLQFAGSYTFQLLGTHTISVHVGASLHVHGPEFAGTAELDVGPFKLIVAFGAAGPPRTTIGWAEFVTTYLPAQVSGVAIETGLRNDGVTVDPASLRLATSSAVPCTSVLLGHDGVEQATGADPVTFGIAPCGVAVGDHTAEHHVMVTKDGTALDADQIKRWFTMRVTTKNLPSALWGAPSMGRPSLGTDAVRSVLGGIVLEPHPAVRHAKPDQPTIEPDFTTRPSTKNVLPQTLPPAAAFTFLSNDHLEPLPEVATARTSALEALGLDPSFVRIGGLPDAGIRLIGASA